LGVICATTQAAVIFRKHDLNQDNYLSREEMMAALQEIGIFNGIRAKHVSAKVLAGTSLETPHMLVVKSNTLCFQGMTRPAVVTLKTSQLKDHLGVLNPN
jgi:hypothetical protein